jgi:predicted nucleic acid-binding protein
MILLDTSGLLAALFTDQRDHAACAGALLAARAPLVLSPFVLAELDYLVTKLAGEAVELELLAEVGRGAYRLSDLDFRDVEQARLVIEQHAGLGIGLTDASLVVLSRRLGCLDLLSLDERHFRVLRGWQDRPFRILPAEL